MKKVLAAIAAALAVVSLVPRARAQEAAMAGDMVEVTTTIEAIDPDVPSVTVQGVDGRTRTLEVDDAEELQGIEVGDEVSITYTQALMIEVK